jgi:hypothetical protein
MNGSTHIVFYKGYSIVCENGLYWISVFPFRKYFTISAVKSNIDKITKDLEDNITTILRKLGRN